MSFAVLGRVRAWRDGTELDLGSPQQRVVLAALLLRRGRPVTTAELVDAVWGDDPPNAAVSVLRTYVSRLRKVLRPGPDDTRAIDGAEAPQVVVSVADGYLARVPTGSVDLGVFEERVAEAQRLRAVGEAPAAARLLHAALAEWEGVPLAGLPGPLAKAERDRLAEERLAALEARLEIDLELGRHSEVIPALVALTGEHPLREGLRQLLMLALYRSGRQAEALETYRRTRGTLVDELGIEPGAPLRELHERILAGEASLDPSAATASAEPKASAPRSAAIRHVAVPAQLPADLPTFTGRQAELEQVRILGPETTTSSSVTVISGMAGIGKTALAVHWAHRI
ncbi:AfsR/SARP family transcriptional regulator, partial [Streptomyces sp. GESEQ-35]|uniref:AfsR/SARP family transcriptional regulator n=1 Tax=Streptomyces sp. GESEQ-35 TaxID=2812657 RepID=UPI001FF0EE50